MATAIAGAIVALALFFAVRHIYHNFRDGKEDCCGNSGCGSCQACHHQPQGK